MISAQQYGLVYRVGLGDRWDDVMTGMAKFPICDCVSGASQLERPCQGSEVSAQGQGEQWFFQ